MFESLRTWSAPYGGDAFLYISFLAVASLVALHVMKPRLSSFTLKRMIRMAALVAVPLSFIAMEMGDNHWGVALVAIVWCVIVAITCKNEATRRDMTKK